MNILLCACLPASAIDAAVAALKEAAGAACDVICDLNWNLGSASLSVISSRLVELAPAANTRRLDSLWWVAAAAVSSGQLQKEKQLAKSVDDQVIRAWRTASAAGMARATLNTHCTVLLAYR